MTKKEDKTEETKETLSRSDEVSTAARAVLSSLKDTGYTREETISILAIATTLLNGEIFMKVLTKNATVVKVPMPGMSKSSRN